MAGFFEKLLEMSLTASCVIVVVLVIRLLLRKAPKKYSYLLWSAAAFRLVCPVTFRSVFSMFQFTKAIERTEIRRTIDQTIFDLPVGPVATQTPSVVPPLVSPPVVTAPPAVNVEPLPEPQTGLDLASAAWEIAAILWLAVLAGLLIYGVASYVRLRRRMANAVRLEGNVYQSDRVRSPFILGVVRPKIYLPFGLTGEQQSYVLAHEGYHIRRLDHIVRPAAFVILALHWFNPLVWAAYYLMGRDMEMSCDEKVLGGAEHIRKAYSITLLSFAANRRFPSPSPLAFGETGVKGRIKNILNWKKPALWVTIAAILLCAVVRVSCATDPKKPDAAEIYRWTSTVTAEEVTRVEAELEGTTATIYGGDNEYVDRLGNERVKVLVSKLNAVPENAIKAGEREDWRISLTIDCGGERYILRLSDNRLGLARGDSLWLMEDEDLDTVARNIAADVLGWDLVHQFETYESVECLYLNPASSQVFFPEMGNGTQYRIGKTHMIANAGDDGTHPERMGDWEPLSGEQWKGLFLGVPRQEYGELTDPMIRAAGEDACLVSAGGELWFVDMAGDAQGRSFVWAMYRLAKVEGAETLDGAYQSVECVYLSPLSSYAAIDGDSGYWYEVSGGRLKLISKQNSLACSYDAQSPWQVLTEETWRELVSDTLMFTDPWDTIKEYERPMIRYFGDSRFLLDMDGELWVGKSGSHPNGVRYLWDLYRLEPMTEKPQVLRECMAVFQADLTHDGQEEQIEITYDYKSMVYRLEVIQPMGMTVLWEGEASSWRGGANGFYLYERDGKTYLMRWVPRSEQGTYCYEYEIFSLSETGEKQMLAENSFRYEVLTQEQMLEVDVDGMLAFENEVNALLADAALLVAVGDNVALGDPEQPANSLWVSPANEWYEKIQAALAEQANVLAAWTVDVTQDGEGETLTIAKTEAEGVYAIKIHRDSYVYWEARLGRNEPNPRLGADVSYWLLERDGKDYLAEWIADVTEPMHDYSYRIFSLTNDGAEVEVRKNELSFTTDGGGLMTLDIKAVRAFVNEVNTELRDADFIAGIEGQGFAHNPLRSDTVFSWYFDTAALERMQAEFFGETPAVHWFAGEKKAEVAAAATGYVKERLTEAGITRGGAAVWSLEEIPTGTVGLWSGNYVYRVRYMLSEYDRSAGEADERLVQQFYVLTHEEWPDDSGHITEETWHLMGVLTEEEVQRFNTPELLEQYGGDEYALYRAAASETFRQWEKLGLCGCSAYQ